MQEGQPGLGLVSSSRQLDHVLPDGVRAGWIETQQHQMSMDCFRAPQDGASAINCWWCKRKALFSQYITGEFEVTNYRWLQISNKSFCQKEMRASYQQ
jgi:hypothetical protein